MFVLEKQLLAERAAKAPSTGVCRSHRGQRDGGAEVTSHAGQALQNNPGLGEIDDFGTAFSASSPATDSKLQILPNISDRNPRLTLPEWCRSYVK